MKRLLILLPALLLLFSACQPKPEISITQSDVTASPEGQTFLFDVVSIYPWTATSSDPSVQITPISADKDSPVSVTLFENTGTANREIVITFTSSNDKYTASTELHISQPPCLLTAEYIEEPKPSGEEFVVKALIKSNVVWSVSSSVATDAISPTSGEIGETEISITIALNKTNDAIPHVFTLSSGSLSSQFTINQPAITILSYGEVDYAVRWLRDGNLWMCENLRFVPEGKTVSSDVADNNGIWYPPTLEKTPITDEDTIATRGLLYNCEVAFQSEITVENFDSFEGVQGICPDGWHIPTATEIVNLVGKGIGELEWNTEAPYFDTETNNSSVTLANEDGFNIKPLGYRNQNNTTTKGAYIGITSGVYTSHMIMGSSVATTNGEPTYLEGDTPGTIKRVQYYGIMPFVNKTNNYLNSILNNHTSGVYVRCIRDAE